MTQLQTALKMDRSYSFFFIYLLFGHMRYTKLTTSAIWHALNYHIISSTKQEEKYNITNHGRRSVLKVARVHFPSLPFPATKRPPQTQLGGMGSAVSSPSGVRDRASATNILGAFRAQNRVWWQQCDMSHNHSLIFIDIDKDCVHCVS